VKVVAYALISECGCIVGAATPDCPDFIAAAIRDGLRVEPRYNTVVFPVLCAQHLKSTVRGEQESA
jgi:hypothetical protein